MAENKFKIYLEENSLYIITESQKYSFNKQSKSLSEINDYNPSQDTKELTIYSFIGVIKAVKNSYIICASEVNQIGKILESNVYKIKKSSNKQKNKSSQN